MCIGARRSGWLSTTVVSNASALSAMRCQRPTFPPNSHASFRRCPGGVARETDACIRAKVGNGGDEV